MTRFAAAVFVAALVAVPSVAYPCGNAVRHKGDKAVREIKRAERLLQSKKYHPLLFYTMRHKFDDPALERRARLIEATAEVRTATTIEDRREQVEELRELRQESGDDPLVQARLAEALVATGEKEAIAEGHALIEDLADRDLMPEAEGWMTAAIARNHAGDRAGRDAAIASCKKVAKGRRNLCRMPAR